MSSQNHQKSTNIFHHSCKVTNYKQLFSRKKRPRSISVFDRWWRRHTLRGFTFSTSERWWTSTDVRCTVQAITCATVLTGWWLTNYYAINEDRFFCCKTLFLTISCQRCLTELSSKTRWTSTLISTIDQYTTTMKIIKWISLKLSNWFNFSTNTPPLTQGVKVFKQLFANG